MADSAVITIVNNLSNQQADVTSPAAFYDEVVFDLGQLPWFTNMSQQQVVGGTDAYALPSTTSRIFRIYFFDYELTELKLRQIESVYPDWRDMKATEPIAYTYSDVKELSLNLVPTPLISGATVTNNWGSTYPVGDLAYLITEYRSTVPTMFQWPVALGILKREYNRYSDHTDMEFAGACEMVASFLLACLA